MEPSPERRPILSETENPYEFQVNLERAREKDLLALLSIFTQTPGLWFNIEYNFYGESCIMKPENFQAARRMTEGKRNEYLSRKAYELKCATDIRIAMTDPDQPDPNPEPLPF